MSDPNSREQALSDALTACLPFIDDAEDVYSLFPDSAASNACRAAVASARAALATSAPRTAIQWPEKKLPDDGHGAQDLINFGWNNCLRACRAAVAAAEGEPK